MRREEKRREAKRSEEKRRGGEERRGEEKRCVYFSSDREGWVQVTGTEFVFVDSESRNELELNCSNVCFI